MLSRKVGNVSPIFLMSLASLMSWRIHRKFSRKYNSVYLNMPITLLPISDLFLILPSSYCTPLYFIPVHHHHHHHLHHYNVWTVVADKETCSRQSSIVPRHKERRLNRFGCSTFPRLRQTSERRDEVKVEQRRPK